MDIAQILAQSGALDSAAQQLGIDRNTAAAGAAVLLPAILGGFKGQAQAQGASGLGGLLQQLGGGGLLDAVVGTQTTQVSQGNDILGQIFGSKDVSRQVAAHASAQSGISAETLKSLLPIVTMLVAGYLSRQGSGADTPAAAPAATGGLGGILGSVFGSVLGGAPQAPAAAPAAPAASGGFGGLASILDLDGDGNPLNDIIGMAGRLRQ